MKRLTLSDRWPTSKKSLWFIGALSLASLLVLGFFRWPVEQERAITSGTDEYFAHHALSGARSKSQPFSWQGKLTGVGAILVNLRHAPSLPATHVTVSSANGSPLAQGIISGETVTDDEFSWLAFAPVGAKKREATVTFAAPEATTTTAVGLRFDAEHNNDIALAVREKISLWQYLRSPTEAASIQSPLFLKRIVERLRDERTLQTAALTLTIILASVFASSIIRRLYLQQPLLPPTPYLLFIVLAAAFTFSLYQNNARWGGGDWHEVVVHYRAARHSFAAGQFPLWNPYFCGGNPLWGSPQATWPSLGFPLTWLFGDLLGTKLSVTVYTFIGLLGMFRLSRTLKLGVPAAVLAASVAMLSGYMSSKIGFGQLLMLTVAWLPWTLHYFFKSRLSLWWVVPSAIAFLLIVVEGMLYIAVAAGLAVSVYVVAGLILGPSRRDLSQRYAAWLAAIMGLGAIKLLPTAEFLAGLQGSLSRTNGIPWPHLLDVVTVRIIDVEHVVSWSEIPWPEYSTYVGWAPLVLAGIGLSVVMRRQQRTWWALIGAALVALVIATAPKEANPLDFIPVINNLRTQARTIIVTVVVLALLSGLGLQKLTENVRPRWREYLQVIIALSIIVDFTAVAAPAFAILYTRQPLGSGQNETFYQERENSGTGYHVAAAGIGAKNYCLPHLTLFQPEAAVWAKSDEEYRGEIYAQGSSRVSLERFTPNAWTMTVDQIPDQGDVVLINQKYAPGWRSRGRVVVNHQGQIALPVSPADSGKKITLYFLPSSFLIGAIISLLTSVGLGVLYHRRHQPSHHSSKLLWRTENNPG